LDDLAGHKDRRDLDQHHAAADDVVALMLATNPHRTARDLYR
jgi:hypothetical protein